jgi:hypothetical protein
MNTCEGELSDEHGVTYLTLGMGAGRPAESKGRKPEVLAYAGKKIILVFAPTTYRPTRPR